MSIPKIVFEFAICTSATVFFSLLMNAPRKTVLLSALIGGSSWTLYNLLLHYNQPEFSAYFFGAILLGFAAEVLARIYKMPASIFILPSLIPIVPGTRLYRTALALVEEDYTMFRDEATRTLFAFCAISVAIAITGVTARSISAYISSHVRRRKNKSKKETGI